MRLLASASAKCIEWYGTRNDLPLWASHHHHHLQQRGIYHGDNINHSGGADPSPTILMKTARYEKLIEAFSGTGYYATDTKSLAGALTAAVASGRPALINCVIDPKAGTESGHLTSFNPEGIPVRK